MAISVPVVAVASSLHLIAFVLSVAAERRRSTGRVVPDEYDERTYCQYDSDVSTAYGLSAFAALLVSQAVVTGVTRCLCFGRGLSRGVGGGDGGSRGCVVCSFALSWIMFLVAEACLLAGSARNAYHTKYWGHFEARDLTSCTTLRKGVFAAAAAFTLLSMGASLWYYWSHSKTNTGGWQKHRNEGLGMTDHHDKPNSEFESVKI
ncbi:hypothetical protein QJS10_CPA03g00602 [Acorus calamus]|uniref:Fiber protein Fb34 n=1 Tax=Acorus calamus TaxID=4465 RepID=A0AAV9F561_ACOCL|nr:hypothetical protein QJS10_CPA03g00602 [Acorus calamus]